MKARPSVITRPFPFALLLVLGVAVVLAIFSPGLGVLAHLLALGFVIGMYRWAFVGLQAARKAARQSEAALAAHQARLAEQVEERTQELARKTRDLETLLYITSHDLSEPLRAIQSFSRLIDERYGEQLDAKGRDFLRRVIRGGDRMERLIDDILTLSRAQRCVRPSRKVNGAQIVAEALARLEVLVRDSGARVAVEEELPDFHLDASWAVQAVYNLLANALKFTCDGQAPDVTVLPHTPQAGEDSGPGLRVCDRGPGVPPEHAELIFQLFQRAVARDVPGTGAGLAIVREIAERHGGRAWCESREGGGSEFIVTFGPDKAAPPLPERSAAAVDLSLNP